MKAKRIMLMGLAMLMAGGLTAQENGLVQDRLLEECRSLMAAGQYRQVELALDKMDRSAYRQVESSRQELDYMRAVAAANLDLPHAGDKLASFLSHWPGSVYSNEVLALMGWYFLQANDARSALECLDECEMMNLDAASRSRAELNQAIAMLRLGRLSQGLQLLETVNDEALDDDDSDYVFFKAYASYQKGDWKSARKGFALCLDGPHSRESRLYLAQIEHEKNNEAAFANLDVEELSGPASDPSISLEAKRLYGEYLLEKGMTDRAVEMLSDYVMHADSLARPYDLYLLGMAYYRMGNWAGAVRYLAPVSEGSGELAQNAALNMGLAALKMDDRNMARMSFELATKLVGRDRVREQALYNYGMSLVDGPQSGFTSAIEVLETFLNEYPSSAYADQASRTLAREYDFSTDYDAALASIARIREPGQSILGAKQNLLYRKGLEQFQNGLYDDAVKLFKESENTLKTSSETTQDLPFWCAEAQYRLGNMAQARQDYLRYMGRTGNRTSKYTDLAAYGLAYIYFNDADYSHALDFLSRSLSQQSQMPQEIKADAMLRRADCYLNLKQYDNAIESYRMAMAQATWIGDYALSQMAVIYGIRQMYGDKTRSLERLVEEYPLSQYVPQALYEIGHTYQQTGSPDKAIQYFDRMISTYPSSDLARRAAVETALVYYQTDRYDQAIAMYKKVIEQYPGSDESRTAMADLRSLYVELGQVDKFIEYTQNTGGVPAVGISERDSLSYAAAEGMFSRGDMAASLKLFQDYLAQFPTGAFQADATYYTAIIFEQDNDYERALDAYLTVAGQEHCRFATSALERAAQMAYTTGDWACALDAYTRLFRKSTDAQMRQLSAQRIVLAAGQIEEYDAILEFSDAALGSGVKPLDKTELQYWTARAMLAKGQNATRLLETLSTDLRSSRGAECDYLLSKYLNDNGQPDKARENIMDLLDKGTPHIYWLARSIVLLSDILKAQGQDVEARQYLISLKSNYTEPDDIQTMIEERLK